MPRQVYLFDRPTRFVAGTVGQPGDRTFYLQASDGRPHGERGAGEDAGRRCSPTGWPSCSTRSPPGPARSSRAEADVDDLEPLTAPVDEEFRVAAMGLAWDGESAAVVVEAVAAGEEPIDEDAILSDSDEGPDALRVTITPGAARAFVARARRVVAAGRPGCPLCSLPLDPAGHVCPRQNGYRR